MLILWLLALNGESPRKLFLGSRGIIQEFKFSILLIPLVLFLVVVASASFQHFAPWLHNVPENPYEPLIQTTADASIFALVAIIAGGVREEIQRAFILCRFERYLGGSAAGVILFSLAFGAGHLIQGWDAAIITTLLGALWSIVYLVRRSVIGPIVSHASFNLIQIIHHLIS
jgi:membrane protease YdiL (CAAX protease family)